MCLRSLYVSPKKKKKIWVFCTHLTATTEGVADGKTTTSHIQISQAKKVKQQASKIFFFFFF